jgi:hypothetical protein
MFVLRNGAVSHHISGQISPRQPEMPRDFPNTPGAGFYQQLLTGLQRLDYRQLAALYRPDALAVNAGFGVVRQGRDSILDGVRQEYRFGGPSVQALTSFVEGDDVVCAEGVEKVRISTRPTTPVAIDLLVADAVIVRGGAVRYQFTCLLRPRPAELQAMLLEYEKMLHRTEMAGLEAVRRSALLLGNPYRY